MLCSLRKTPVVLLLAACSGTGQSEVSYPAYAVVVPPSGLSVGAWTVTISEAAFAFGPLYFCSAAQAGCEVANSELLAITRIDALDPSPQPIGQVRGFEGDIRSASFDYGIHWFVTESHAQADPAAPDGHSARFVGRADNGDLSFNFVVNVDVKREDRPENRGLRAVSSVAAKAAIRGDRARLDVRFDVQEWLRKGVERLDFEGFSASGCELCTIDSSSATTSHTAITQAMQGNPAPEFVWSGADVGALP
jgi:hypothetical protein